MSARRPPRKTDRERFLNFATTAAVDTYSHVLPGMDEPAASILGTMLRDAATRADVAGWYVTDVRHRALAGPFEDPGAPEAIEAVRRLYAELGGGCYGLEVVDDAEGTPGRLIRSRMSLHRN